MAEAAALPKQESLFHGNLYMRLSSRDADNDLPIAGPCYVKLRDNAGETGLYFLDDDGQHLAIFRSDGSVLILGVAILVTSIAGTGNGFYFADKNDNDVVWLDMDGNLHVLYPVGGIGSLDLDENVAGIGTFPTPMSRSFGTMPKMTLAVGNDLDTPILQVLNRDEDVVIKVEQDGRIKCLKGLAGGLSAGRIIRGSIRLR